MTKYFYFYFLSIFLYNISEFSCWKSQCVYGKKTYEYGEKFHKEENVCHLCVCTHDNELRCKIKNNCSQLKCSGKNKYAEKCCLLLNCTGNFNLNRINRTNSS